LSLKIIKFEPRIGRVVLIAAAALCVTTSWFFVKWNFANSVASRLDTKRAEFKPVADWLMQMAPSDPQTHLTKARVYQRTFDTVDLTRSLNEYEMAVALSPNNYFTWVDLGKARSLNGDTEGALAAYESALQLAPNYSAVQWVYGNALVRQGKTDEGFSFIAKAAASNPEYAQSAIQTALQIFDFDVPKVIRALGEADATNAALAIVLANQMHFDEAFAAWSKLPDADKAAKFKTLGQTLLQKFAEAKRFQLAARVASDIRTESERPIIGQVSNGGFESGVKLRDAGLFEWQITEAAQPQIGLTETQPHGGRYSLLIVFNSFETTAFRSVSQTVAVDPGAEYEFEAFYRSDVKTQASLKLEITNALTSAPIASLPLIPAADWTPLNAKFRMPPDSDGIVIRLTREGCASITCPTNGSLAFDDFSLKRL
jgi:tetratricopeptide (TPR) repeat protein